MVVCTRVVGRSVPAKNRQVRLQQPQKKTVFVLAADKMAAVQSNLLRLRLISGGGNTAVDEESAKGRFAWTTIGTTPIPYIFRCGVRFCSVRMVIQTLLTKYLYFLHPEVINSGAPIESYHATATECELLNEVNIKHCDCQFSSELFTTADLIVRLDDVEELHTFLNVCYNKLVCGNICTTEFGFYKINEEYVVAYVTVKENRYVPLFFFDGETDSLDAKAIKLDGWSLAYLKFGVKLQSLDGERYVGDSCLVVNVEELKNYFPPGSKFEEYWPGETKKFLVNTMPAAE